MLKECKRCSECRNSKHHWICNGEFYDCKHCDAKGEMCDECDGTGEDGLGKFIHDLCPHCDGHGVIEVSELYCYGFRRCEFDDSGCDQCKQSTAFLYFLSNGGYDAREGEYYCAACAEAFVERCKQESEAGDE